jgi:hypothetical protein
MDAIGLIVFLAICGGSLFIMAGIVYLREKYGEKHHKDAEA